MKTITLDRAELVWETRRNTWDATDWDRLLTWMKARVTNPNTPADDWFKAHYTETYNHIKDLTWEQAVEQFEKYRNGDEDYIKWTETFGDYSCENCVFDILQEQIREDNYESDVYDCDYADDYEEEYFIEDDGDDYDEQ